jgi:hypothetical protein
MNKYFDLFLEEVRLTYGKEIAEVCKNKLSSIKDVKDVNDVNEVKILGEAKKETGFDPKKSSLYAAGLRFNT